MRTIKGLPVPQDGNDAKFPFGQLRNETSTEQGTPVVREIYGDLIVNLYKLLDLAGIAPTQTEDSEDSQFQIVEALKVFVNSTNDLQQLLSVEENKINCLLDFDLMPSGYIFIGKISESIDPSITGWEIVSSGEVSYPISRFVGTITSGDSVLVVLDVNGVTVTGLNSLEADKVASVNTTFGSPLAFNESSQMLYFSAGNLITEQPKSYDLQSAIDIFSGSSNNHILEVIFFKGKLICSTFDNLNLIYKLFAFDKSNFTDVESEIVLTTETGVNNSVYMFCDGEFLYFTNSAVNVNSKVNDYEIGKFTYNVATSTLSAVTFLVLNPAFQKTTNTFIDKNTSKIFTFVNGYLHYFHLQNGAIQEVAAYANVMNGVVFKFNENTYYSNGNIASKWEY